MKTKLLISMFALTLVFSLAGCGNNNTGGTDSNNSDNIVSDIQSGVDSVEDNMESGLTSATDTKISRDQAKKIALDDAKLKEADISNYRIELDTDNGVLEYDIEFDHNGTEYDYEIDANTGDIRERSQDKAD